MSAELSEQEFDSSIAGGAAVVDFWAPWCPYCIADMPSWQTIAEEYGDSVVILAVDVGGDTFGEMKQFIAKSGYDFTWGIINADMAQSIMDIAAKLRETGAEAP